MGEVTINVRIEGKGANGGIGLRQIAHFSEYFVSAAELLVRGAVERAEDEDVRNLPDVDIRALADVRLVGYELEEGCVELKLKASAPDELVERTGISAQEELIGNLAMLRDGKMPKGCDLAVLVALRVLGELLVEQGIERIKFMLEAPGRRTEVIFDYDLMVRIGELIGDVSGQKSALCGRLVMADFRAETGRCLIETDDGREVLCTFEEVAAGMVAKAMLHYVVASGPSEIDDERGVVITMHIQEIKMIDLPLAAYWEDLTIDQIVKRRGVRPFERPDNLKADFWPEDESADEIAGTIRRWRDEDKIY